MPTRRFQRRPEDFTCAHCGVVVQGNGYTNHCPACLWSQHVDVNPGDRAEPCSGLMEPISADLVAGEWVLVHRCQRCGAVRKNQAAPDDDRELLISLSARPTP